MYTMYVATSRYDRSHHSELKIIIKIFDFFFANLAVVPTYQFEIYNNTMENAGVNSFHCEGCVFVGIKSRKNVTSHWCCCPTSPCAGNAGQCLLVQKVPWYRMSTVRSYLLVPYRYQYYEYSSAPLSPPLNLYPLVRLQ